MINYLIYLLISSIFVLDWLFFKHGIGVRIMTWIPEFVSIVVALLIPFKTAVSKKSYLPLKYIFLIFLYLLHLLIGFLLNDVKAFTILAGLRIYTKFIPIFLLPFIFPFTEDGFKKVLIFIFSLSMIQFPVVLWQRFVAYSTSISGDPVGGTLGASTSGALSIFLLIIISFLISFYYKDKISLPFFLLLMGAAFIPITLNETKISFALLPVAFIFPAFFLRAKRGAIFRVMLVILILFVSFIALRGIYDHFQTKKWGYGIKTFFLMPGRLEYYSNNRLDPIKYSFTKALDGPKFVVFGRGAGNVSEGFTRKLSGKYIQEAYTYGVYKVAFTRLMWELGLGGTILFFLFPFFVFLDAVQLCKQEGLTGTLSLGMLSFVVFFVLSSFYLNSVGTNLFMYMFFLLAGYLINWKNTNELEKNQDGASDVLSAEDDILVSAM